ncbi:MAG: FliI/YscN family ATPase [Phycisphaerae bacterium]|nr:FliI/YscN family ATPase [Phycisphaerae bacterium]
MSTASTDKPDVPSGGLTVFDAVADEVSGLISEEISGEVTSVRGMTIGAGGLPVPVGARCEIQTRRSGRIGAEAVGLRADETLLSVFDETVGIAPGDRVWCRSGAPRVPVGFDLLGRVIDGQGQPLDGNQSPLLTARYPLFQDAPAAMTRRAIDQPLGLGVRALDGMLTAGLGQRLGIFAGTGVGKSVLMGMICRNTQADVNVIALIGERGREVGNFIRNDLGPEGLARSVVVVCTSDIAPAVRVRACLHATAIAEFFRDQGLNVLLMMDSLTRFAMAQRQIGLAAGEPPTAKGYPPSVFAMLPRVLERAGRTRRGSITGIYTVLVEGDDIDEPLADAARGILDGHIWLARDMANRGQYPAIDVLGSISRVAEDVTDKDQRTATLEVRRVLAVWHEIEDLVSIGAYVPGANVEYDVAVQMRELINKYLQQDRTEGFSFAESREQLIALGDAIARTRQAIQGETARGKPRANGTAPRGR